MSSIYQPVERYRHSTVQVGDYLYMWGGRLPDLPKVHNNKEKKSMCSVVEVCHVPTGEWVQKPTTGDPPLGVKGYAAAVIKNEIFFYGGYCGHDICFHNSLYSFNVDTFNWKELSPTTTHHGPMMKKHCGMVALQINDEDYLVVIGGVGSFSTPPQPGAQYIEDGSFDLCNEVHMYRLKTGEWTSPAVTGDRPPPIEDFTLTSITNTTVILFGGNTGDTFSDAYIFEFSDTSSVKGTKFPNPGPGSVQWPQEKCGHSSVLINCSSRPHLLVVGGYCTSDCWLLNINKMKWKELANIPDSVTGRNCHSLSVWNETPTTHWIIEFGGESADDSSILSDTTFIEITSSGDLVVQSVLDINEYRQRRVRERLEKVHIKDPASDKEILDKKPQMGDLHRLFKSSAVHYSTIGAALDVQVNDLLHSEKSASDKLILVFERWMDFNKGVTWRKVLQVCDDYPEEFGRTKAEVKQFLSSDRARDNY